MVELILLLVLGVAVVGVFRWATHPWPYWCVGWALAGPVYRLIWLGFFHLSFYAPSGWRGLSIKLNTE